MDNASVLAVNKRANRLRRAIYSRLNAINCCAPRKNQEAEDDAEDARLAALAPIDERACREVLQTRGCLQDIESEWNTDDAWLDRVVCGRMDQTTGKNTDSFFALLILSTAAPIQSVCPEAGMKKLYEDPYLWPQWCQKRSHLRVDHLHLVPLSGRSKTTEEAADSLDLGSLIRPPTLVTGAGDLVTLTLDFGCGALEFIVSGEKQAQRWVLGIQVVLMSCLSAAAELEGPMLMEALQKFDKIEKEKRFSKALKEQRKILLQIAQEDAEQAEEEEDFEDIDVDEDALKNKNLAAMMNVMAAKIQRPTTQKLLEALERIAALPRLLVTASVRSNPVRQDVLSYWEQCYHRPLCKGIEAIWYNRVRKFSPGELLKLVNFIHQYRVWLEGVRITDSSLGRAIAECADVYGRRFFPSLVSLTENVAELCEAELIRNADSDGHSRMGTSAPIDLFYFLGPPIEAALSGAQEMRMQAAEIVEGAFMRYQKFLKWRLLDAIEFERTGEMPKGHRRLMAAFLEDSEDFAENCHQVLVDVGERGDDVADVFHRIEGRFRNAAEGFCESLVTLCLRTAGAPRIFGLPPTPAKLVDAELRQFLTTDMTFMVSQFQDFLSEPWRSRFALRLTTRFIALELFILTHVPASLAKEGKDKKSKSIPPTEEIIKCLMDHEKAFKESLSKWVSEGQSMFIDVRMKPLRDVISILSAKPEALAATVKKAAQRHNGALSGHVTKALLSLRSDLEETVRNAAVKAAATLKRDKISKVETRLSFIPVEEARMAVSATSAFQWAMELEWVNEVFGLNKKKDLTEELAKRPRPRRVKRKTDEEKNAEKGAKVLCGDAFGGKLQFHLYNKRLETVTPSKGITVVVLSEDLDSVKEYQSFDTGSSKIASDDLEQFLRALEEHTVIMAGTLHDGAAHLTNNARDAFAEFGARKVMNLEVNNHYAMVGVKVTDHTAEDNEAEEAINSGGLAKAVHVLKPEKRAAITSAGFDDGSFVEFSLEGEKLRLDPPATQGFTVIVLTDADEIQEYRTFDTMNYEQSAFEMATFLDEVSYHTRIMVGIMEDGATNITDSVKAALKKFGAAKIDELNIGDSYALLGRKGDSIDDQDPMEALVIGGEGKATIDQMASKAQARKKKQKAVIALDDFLSGVEFNTPAQAAEPAVDTPDRVQQNSDSDDSDEEEESEDDDELLRGFLYHLDDYAHRKAAMTSATGLVTLRWVTAAKKGGETISHLIKGGWKEHYAAVKKDFRGNRILFWYEQMDDTVAQGSVPIAEIDSVNAREDPSNIDLPAVLDIFCRDVTGANQRIEFRSPWMNECKFWVEKLTLLRDREVSEFDRPDEKKDGVVLVLQPLLCLRDPERTGAAVEDE